MRVPSTIGACAVVSWGLLGTAVAYTPLPLPGTPTAYSRHLGSVDTDPDRFVHSLNRVLLERIDPKHDWTQVVARQDALRLMQDLAELERRFGRAFRVGTQGEDRKRFVGLCETLGYGARFKGGEPQLVPRSGDAAVRGRRLAEALGWDLPRIAGELRSGSRTLEIASATVSFPITAGEWQAIVDRRAELSDPLGELVRDQRLGLVLEARRRLSTDTRAALGSVGWNWLYRKADPFFRYAPALRFEEGRLLLPGDDAARGAWASLLGSSPDRPAELVRDLLDKRGARGAFLVHSLSYVPPGVVNAHIGAGDAATAGERFGRQVFRRIDETTAIELTSPRGGDWGFGTLVRSLPLAADGRSFLLPGGPGLWYQALRSAEAPTDPSSLDRIVRRGQSNNLSEADFLLRALTERNTVDGVDVPVLPRLIRTANMFGGDERILTPGNVVLLARASDTAPDALEVLEAIEPTRAEAVRDHLLAVAHLATLSRNVQSELLISIYQGGTAWLRTMAGAGRVDRRLLEERLQAWARLHHGATDPHAVAPAQLDWIVATLAALPERPAEAPGRDDWERRFVGGLVAPTAGTAFEFQGVEYESQRESLLASSLAGHLARGGIPSAGALVGLDEAFAALARAAAAGDLEQARSVATQAAALVSAFAGADLELAPENKDVAPRMLATDRPELLRLLESIGSIRRPEALRRRVDDVRRAEGLLARELRPFLLAPTYLSAMGNDPSLFFQDPHLIRKHLLFRSVGAQIASDNPWRHASVNREVAGLGAHVHGSLASTAAALAEFSAAVGAGAFLHRDRVWFADYVETRWHGISAETVRALSVLDDIGGWLVDQAIDEVGTARPTAALAFYAERLPLARMEDQARLGSAGRDELLYSPSELLVLGLGLVTDDGFSRPSDLRLPADLESSWLAATSALGPDWRTLLDRAGGRTPALNGRSSPWVGYWPPYELLENERLLAALIERCMIDLRFAVLRYLGRRALPGEVAAELFRSVLREASESMRLESLRDWEGHIGWVNALSDEWFDTRVRELFTEGYYTARGF
ncbi:MAG TPA: hypothetical protein VNB06_05800 [Thermoanaerobaculia bacterium]|nr:hypothetical protein [Thermoanaerobaculia bacterium]